MLIDTAAAKAHVRREAGYPDEQITPYLLAAEAKAQQFVNRRIYADQAALNAAVAAVPAALSAAGAAYTATVAVVGEEPDVIARCVMMEDTSRKYRDAQTAAREVLAGIVINDPIRAAILELFRFLYERGDGSAAMPAGVEYLLWDYRVGLGV
jgi:hypothetical protein